MNRAALDGDGGPQAGHGGLEPLPPSTTTSSGSASPGREIVEQLAPRGLALAAQL